MMVAQSPQMPASVIALYKLIASFLYLEAGGTPPGGSSVNSQF